MSDERAKVTVYKLTVDGKPKGQPLDLGDLKGTIGDELKRRIEASDGKDGRADIDGHSYGWSHTYTGTELDA